VIDERARRRAEAHLERLNGLVTGLHVVGSAVLDDYRDGSDLDVVCELSAIDEDVLRDAHRADPGVEATYVQRGDLRRRVDEVPDGPWAAEGELHTDSRSFQLNPVTWAQLARHAVTLHGDPPRPPLEPDALQRFCAANLAGYWSPLLDTVRRAIADRAPGAAADPGTVQWIALGPPRLWHTIRTGEIVSKSRAGELAAEHWPDLAGPLVDIVATRRGQRAHLTTRHAHAALTVGDRIMG
jgi:hypothetical protein